MVLVPGSGASVLGTDPGSGKVSGDLRSWPVFILRSPGYFSLCLCLGLGGLRSATEPGSCGPADLHPLASALCCSPPGRGFRRFFASPPGVCTVVFPRIRQSRRDTEPGSVHSRINQRFRFEGGVGLAGFVPGLVTSLGYLTRFHAISDQTAAFLCALGFGPTLSVPPPFFFHLFIR